jgi:hypothetical protein
MIWGYYYLRLSLLAVMASDTLKFLPDNMLISQLCFFSFGLFLISHEKLNNVGIDLQSLMQKVILSQPVS